MTKEPAIYARMSYPITVTHGCCITVMLGEEETLQIFDLISDKHSINVIRVQT